MIDMFGGSTAFEQLVTAWKSASESERSEFLDYVSGATKPSARKLKTQARELLQFMNAKKGGRGYPESDVNLKLIIRRLQEFEYEELRAIIAIKWRQVEDGSFDRKYFRPSTLFNNEKCSQYLGELG